MAKKKRKSFTYEYGGNSLGLPKWSPMMKAEYGYGDSTANKALDFATENIDKVLPPTNPLSIGLKILNTGIDMFNVHRTNKRITKEKNTLLDRRDLINNLMDPASNKDTLDLSSEIGAQQSEISRIENLEEQNMMTDAILPNVKNLGNAALGTAGVDYTADDFDAGEFATNLFSGNAAYGGNKQQPSQNYEAEGGEVIQHEPGNPPGTSGNMKTVGNNPTLSKLEGKSHDQGGEAVSSEGDQYVYSNKLKSDEWGITFAEAAEKIAKKIEKFEEAASDGDKITKDTAAAMIQEWNGRLMALKEEQERKREEKFMEMLQGGSSMEELAQHFPDILEKFMKENLAPEQEQGQTMAPPGMDQNMGGAEALLPPDMQAAYGGRKMENGGDDPATGMPDENPWLPRTDVGTPDTQNLLTEMTFSGYNNPLEIYSNDPKMSEYLRGLSGGGDDLGAKWWEGLPPDLKAKSEEMGITGLGSFGDDVNLITQFEEAANELGYEMPIEPLGKGKVGEYILGVSNFSPDSRDGDGDGDGGQPDLTPIDIEKKEFEGFPDPDPPELDMTKQGCPCNDLVGTVSPECCGDKTNFDGLGINFRNIFNRKNKEKIKNKKKEKQKIDNKKKITDDKTITSGDRAFNFTDLKLSPLYNLFKSKEELTPTNMRINPFYHQLTTREDKDVNIQPQLNRNLDMMYTNLDLSKDFTGGSSAALMNAFNMADQTRMQGDSAAWASKYQMENQIEAQNDAMKMGMGEGFAAEQRRVDEIIGLKQGKRQEFEKAFFEQIDALGDMNTQTSNMMKMDQVLSKVLQEIHGIDVSEFKSKFGGPNPEYDVNVIDWNDPEIISVMKRILKNN